MARLVAGADGSFAALDAVYAREGGSGILELGGAADPRIVVWAMVRGLRLAEFEERKQAAMASSTVVSAFRYLHTGLAPRIIAELLGPSDRRVMRIVSSKWRAHLDKPGWRAEEVRQEERILKLAAGMEDLTRLLQGGMWLSRLVPTGHFSRLRATRGAVHKTVRERICALHAEVEAELAGYADGRAALVAGLVRSMGDHHCVLPSPAGTAKDFGSSSGEARPQGKAEGLGALVSDIWRRMLQRGVYSRLRSSSSEDASEDGARTLCAELVDVRERLATARETADRLQNQVARETQLMNDAANPPDYVERVLFASAHNQLLQARQDVTVLEQQERTLTDTSALVHAAIQRILDAAGPQRKA
jgi:hypothetical protein